MATADHGTLGLGSPWTRALFPGPARTEVEALIPAGFQINVTAVDGRPGPWRVSTYRVADDGSLVELVSATTTHSPASFVRRLAEQLRESAATSAA